MPTTIRMPHQGGDAQALTLGHEGHHDPDQRDRDGEEHDERQPQRLELRGHDHEHHHHRQADGHADAAEGLAQKRHLADELEVDVAGARIALQLLLQLGGGGAEVTALGLHQQVRGPLQLVPLHLDGAQRAPDPAVGG
jgi:hypothetical protein